MMTLEEMGFVPVKAKEKYSRPLPEATMRKLEKGYLMSLELPPKDIRCPYCGYLLERFYGNVGLFRSVCPRCGRPAVINVPDWRRRRLSRLRYGDPEGPLCG